MDIIGTLSNILNNETVLWAIGVIITVVLAVFAIILSIYRSRKTDKKINATKEEQKKTIRQVTGPGRPTVSDYVDGYPKLPDKTIRETYELALKFRDQQDYDTAIKTLRTLLVYNPTKEQHVAVLSLIGNTHYLKGDYLSAKKSQSEALDIALTIQNKIAITITAGNLGRLCDLTGEPDKALEYYNQALEIDRQLGYKLGEAIQLGNIGIIYREKGEPDTALEYHIQALEINRQLGNKRGEAIQLGNIGLIYWNKGKPDTALEFFEKSLKIFRIIKAVDLVTKIKMIISRIKNKLPI
jgi:tetratricopeptide (TPR) repeat protein